MAKSAGGLVAKGKGKTKTTTKQTKPKSEEKPSFETVRTYQDLINANVAFLQGHLDKTPYHDGEVDKETVPLLGDLVKINRRGFVSLNGQPGLYEHGFIKDTWPCGGKTCGDWWYEDYQKPFIDGLMKKVDLPQFQKFMKQYADSYYYKVHGTDISTFPFYPYNLTRGRSHKNKAMLKSTPWEEDTHVHSGDEGNPIHYFSSDIQRIINKEAYWVTIAGSTYNEGSTEKLLLNFYRSLA